MLLSSPYVWKGGRLAISLSEDLVNIYLRAYCESLQSLDCSIRFVGIADYGGKLVSSFYRAGLVPLMDPKETGEYALQAVFRARSSRGFKPQLGESRYSVEVYEKLIRSTLTVASEEAEHHSMYVLVSLDIGSNHANVIDNVIIPYVSTTKKVLFVHTRAISEKYWD